MKLTSFKDKFPIRPSKILCYNKDNNCEYSACSFGDSPVREHNSYLYLVKNYTHWMYVDDLPRPEEDKPNGDSFIFESLDKILDEQEKNVVDYMNKYMTKEERNRHGDNIWGYLARKYGVRAQIEMEMMADGRKTIQNK